MRFQRFCVCAHSCISIVDQTFQLLNFLIYRWCEAIDFVFVMHIWTMLMGKTNKTIRVQTVYSESEKKEKENKIHTFCALVKFFFIIVVWNYRKYYHMLFLENKWIWKSKRSNWHQNINNCLQNIQTYLQIKRITLVVPTFPDSVFNLGQYIFIFSSNSNCDSKLNERNSWKNCELDYKLKFCILIRCKKAQVFHFLEMTIIFKKI